MCKVFWISLLGILIVHRGKANDISSDSLETALTNKTEFFIGFGHGFQWLSTVPGFLGENRPLYSFPNQVILESQITRKFRLHFGYTYNTINNHNSINNRFDDSDYSILRSHWISYGIKFFPLKTEGPYSPQLYFGLGAFHQWVGPVNKIESQVLETISFENSQLINFSVGVLHPIYTKIYLGVEVGFFGGKVQSKTEDVLGITKSIEEEKWGGGQMCLQLLFRL